MPDCKHWERVHVAESPLWVCTGCGGQLRSEEWRRLRGLRAAASRLDAAIVNEGPARHLHRDQVDRLRREWPTLWAAIEDVREANR